MSGEVSDRWQTVELASIAQLSMGETLLSKNLTGDGVPVFSANTDEGPWGYTNNNRRRLRRGDIVLGARGSIGFPRRPDFDAFTCTQTTIAIEPNHAAVDSEYLYHALCAADILGIASQQAVPMLTIGSLSPLEFRLPPLDEQRRIAEVLRSVDEAIAAADDALTATKQVFAQVRAELVEDARRNFDEIAVVDAIAKNRGEKITKLQTSEYQDQGTFPIIDQGASFICGYTDDQSALWPYGLPVIVFGDHTRIFKFVDFPFAIGADGTQCITPAAGLDARYVYYTLQSLDLRGEGYARHFKLLKEKTIPVPDMPTQLEVADQLSALEQSIASGEATRQRLQETKRALMSDLLSGRVRVPT